MSISRRVSLAITETVRSSDRTTHQLDLRDILGSGRMRELLADELEERDFERTGDTLHRTEEDGVVITVDLDSLEMTARLERQEEVEEERQVRDRKARSDVSLSKEAREEVKRKLTRELEEGEEERLQEMNEALEAVYAEALKEKARQMGDVTSVQEGKNENEDYELVIEVEV